MRSALVQGFYAGTLYAEPGRAAIVAEVTGAKRLGLNTLRLHIKAFDPVYLDVCDELGMLLHCDIPVAEPIAHAELGLAARWRTAAPPPRPNRSAATATTRASCSGPP